MNVFVLSTGRCGSTTFARACSHITNYSSKHESLSQRLGNARFAYPDNHIESDNRLSWMLGKLDSIYGADAFYVHLRRNDLKTAQSFVRRYEEGIIAAYRDAVLMGAGDECEPIDVSIDYIDTVNSNIELFLRNKPNKMLFRLEEAGTDFKVFWDLIGADGDFGAAQAEFSILHNASKKPKTVTDRIRSVVKRLGKSHS